MGKSFRRVRPLLVACVVMAVAVTAYHVTDTTGTPQGWDTQPAAPSIEQARHMLKRLDTAAERDMSDYDRDHWMSGWVTVRDGCDARELILARDAIASTAGEDCYPSGKWRGVYNEATYSHAGDVQIDHIVPLGEAHRSREWTDTQRHKFAMDPMNLWAVSGSENQSKSDKDPREPHGYQPPNNSVRCEYAKRWIQIKAKYDMAAQKNEKGGLAAMLNTCRK